MTTKAKTFAGFFAAIALGLSGCGGAVESGTWNCDLSATFAKMCMAASFTGTKMVTGATCSGPVVAECPMSGIVATCTVHTIANQNGQNIDLVMTYLYYAGASLDTAQRSCTFSQGTWAVR